MKTIYKHCAFLVLTAFLGLTVSLSAQSSHLMYGTTRIPQMNQMNPAFFPNQNKIYINTFGINMSTSLPVNLKDMVYDTVMPDPNTGAKQHYNYVNLNSWIDQLTSNSQLNMALNQYLLGFGFRFAKHHFITFSTQIRTTTSLGLPVQALKLLTEGNANMDGTAHTVELLNGSLLNAQVYGEMGLGYGINIGNLTVGARIKPILGVANVTTESTHINLVTDEDLSKLHADVYYNVRFALPMDIELGENTTFSDLQDKLKNATVSMNSLGWGLDLGGKYDWKNFEFSASITDMGKVKWKNVYELRPRDGEDQSFVFDGVDISTALNNGELDLDTVLNQYKDQIESLKDAIVTRGASYSTGLNTKFNLAGFYNFPSVTGIKFRAGALFHGELTPRMLTSVDNAKKRIFRDNFSIMGSVNLFNQMEFTISNAIISNGYKTRVFNPGFGANFMIGRAAQFYILMDYGSFNFSKVREANIYLGTNILIGNKPAVSVPVLDAVL